jgi:hypothetical protein
LFIQRARAAIAVLLLLGSTLFISATPAYAAYTTNCNGPDTYPDYVGVNNEHEYIEVNTSNIVAGWATLTYYPLKACTPINGLSSVSMAFPVSLQNPVCGAQVGVGSWNTANYFIWTPVDNCVVEAITDGSWPTPVSGHIYTFGIDIEFNACPGPKWRYTMHDYTAGGPTYFKCGSRSVGSVTRLWSGFEVYDDGDQMGGSSNSVFMQDIIYTNTVSSYYLTSTTVIKNVGDPRGIARSYWHTTAQTISGHARIYSYTSNR